MKVERFIKEYALYRTRELQDFIEDDIDSHMEEEIIRRIVHVRRIVKARENGLITVNEAMQQIMDA